MHDELARRYRFSRQHVFTGQQVQPGCRVFILLHIHKPALRTLHYTGRHPHAIARRPHNLAHGIARQQRLQQLAAQLVEVARLQNAGQRFRIRSALGAVCLHRLNLPGLADQRQLALLQTVEHLAIAAQVPVDLHAAIAALHQQRVIGAQYTHVRRLERVAQTVGKLGVQLGPGWCSGRCHAAGGANAFSHGGSPIKVGRCRAGRRSCIQWGSNPGA